MKIIQFLFRNFSHVYKILQLFQYWIVVSYVFQSLVLLTFSLENERQGKERSIFKAICVLFASEFLKLKRKILQVLVTYIHPRNETFIKTNQSQPFVKNEREKGTFKTFNFSSNL